MTTTCFEVLTIFPEAIDGFVGAGLLGKAIERGLVEVRTTNIRDFTTDKHHSVDDTPFGGGPGMVMRPGPVVDALESVIAVRGPMHRVMLTPSAPRFDQRAAERLAALPRIALLCGRYEGIDERVREHFIDECFSIGDYVLGGGEVAALVVIEAVSRLVGGVLGNPASAVLESFHPGEAGTWLEHPQYTRPAEFRGHAVPEVLLGGDHAAIQSWRAAAARRRTWALRPDLRPRRALPPGCPRWLAIDDSEGADVESLAQVALRHRVAGVALLDSAPELAVRWAAATGGRVPTATLPSLAALRKRLRRGSKVEPWLVRLAGAAKDEEAHARSAAELADALVEPGPAPEPRPLVLWLADPHAAAPPSLNAVFAPMPENAAREGLAIPDAIDDGPAPRQRPAELANVALATLGGEPQSERAEP